MLVVIAGSDEIIPRERSEALAAAFRPGQAQIVVIEGAGHNTLDYSGEYLGEVRGILAPRVALSQDVIGLLEWLTNPPIKIVSTQGSLQEEPEKG